RCRGPLTSARARPVGGGLRHLVCVPGRGGRGARAEPGGGQGPLEQRQPRPRPLVGGGTDTGRALAVAPQPPPPRGRLGHPASGQLLSNAEDAEARRGERRKGSDEPSPRLISLYSAILCGLCVQKQRWPYSVLRVR